MLHPTLRRCFFWSHLAVGIVAGLIILILAFTGLMMSFETQIINRVESSMVRSSAEGKTQLLTPAEMVGAFEKAGVKGKPTTLNFTNDADAPVIFLAGRGNQQLFHPTTGEAMGKGAVGTRRFFQINLSLHRWLTWPMQQRAGQENAGQQQRQGSGWRDIGGQVVSAGTLLFLFLLISGLVIWIPKKRVWRAFKVNLTLQRRLKGRARDWNWHNVAGIWASPFILVICLTGLIMAYPWANGMLYSAFGESVPKRQAGGQQGGREGGKEGGGKMKISTTHLDALAEFAKKQVPDWRSMSLELPTNDEQPLVVTVTDAGRGRPDRRQKFTVTPDTFEIVKRETSSDLKPVAQARQFVRWLHTGEAFGWIGQLLMALACSAALVLVWTGFALSFRRFFPKRKKMAAA
ncbi:MAG: PepSY-associated TM helix domain-containing protein [Luteolibacter sp.]